MATISRAWRGRGAIVCVCVFVYAVGVVGVVGVVSVRLAVVRSHSSSRVLSVRRRTVPHFSSFNLHPSASARA